MARAYKPARSNSFCECLQRRVPMSRFRQTARLLSLTGASTQIVIGTLIIIGAIFFASTPARAQSNCYWDTHTPIDRWVCPQQRARPSPNPDRFGAIALSDASSLVGTASGATSRVVAESTALARCSKLAPDCRLQSWGRNTCLAIVISESDGAWGVDDDPSVSRAQATAMAECQKGNGKDCRIRTYFCTGG